MNKTIFESLYGNLTYLYDLSPRIAVKIESHWGTKQCHDYLLSLIEKDRDHRAGFPHATFTHIMDLYLLHVTEFGDFSRSLTVSEPNIDLS